MSNWMQYDIDWPPFAPTNSSYLNIGIPPVVSKNYRQQYMNFWNNVLSEQLNGDLKAIPSSTDRAADESTSFVKPLIPHVNYYLDKSTENPIRQLQYLLHNNVPNRSEMYATQSTVETPRAFDAISASPENTFVLGDNKIIVKADSTLNVLIAMVIIFLVINVIIITIYLVRRNYFKRNLKQKLDILSLDGTTDDDLKRSNKFDGDESFILDIVRRKNEYVPVKRYHSPINGFLLTRHYSTSTVDTHTKVSDWISHEVNRQSPHLRSKSPSFSFGTSNLYYGKKADAANGCDNNLNATLNERHPIELMKSKSFELNRKTGIIYQESGDCAGPIFEHAAAASSSNPIASSACVLQIDHRHTNSDPASIPFTQNGNEKVTSFIEDVDVNVTSRDECDGASHFRLTPEETLQIYQMRNYPKVLPKHPNPSNSEYVSTSSFKRRSMPSYQHMITTYARAPPVPPPRTTSTLDRMMNMRRSDGNRSEPLMPVMAEPIPESPIEEPEKIEIAALHVGPLLPGSKENLYSTVNRRKFTMNEEKQPCTIAAQIERQTDTMPKTSSHEKAEDINRNGSTKEPHVQPKSIMKRPFMRQNSGDGMPQPSGMSTQVLSTSSKIPVLSRLSTSAKSNSSSSNSDSKSSGEISTDDSAKDLIAELNRSEASITSSLGTCSSAETVKQIF